MGIQKWSEIGFILITTEDGSPSLRLPTPVRAEFNDGESMHHSGGALTETLYIYGPVFDWTYQKLHIEQKALLSRHLVVGLGLGYIEMMIAFKALMRGLTPEEIHILSYESETPLVNLFSSFIRGEELSEEIEKTYLSILQGLRLQLQAEGNSMRSSLSISDMEVKVFLQKVLKLTGALSPQSLPTINYEAIYFDAFSKKTSPELWSEEFLQDFFKKVGQGAAACLGTYACNGNLKRALKKSDFQLQEKTGFQSKRNASFAIRGDKAIF